MLGIHVPIPPEADKDDLSRWPAHLCVLNARAALFESKALAPAERLSESVRRCLAARLYLACIAVKIDLSHGTPEAFAAIVRSAKEFEESACRGKNRRLSEELYVLSHPFVE